MKALTALSIHRQAETRQHYDVFLAALAATTDVHLLPFFSFDAVLQWDIDKDRLPDIVVTHDGFSHATALACRAWMARQVPVLLLMDGILEWRNSWEHPRGGTNEPTFPMYQPAIAHKVACIGRSQIRVLESWGNLGLCELVGASRLDGMTGRLPRSRSSAEPYRILVMTAKNLGFTPEQANITRQAVAELKEWFDGNLTVDGVAVRPVWRLTAQLADLIGVPNELRDLSGDDLATTLKSVDAVITTPSTAMLEGMLQGVPVALLDYHHRPHYVPAAWTIPAASFIAPVIRDLLSPPPARLLHQHFLLHDALECRSPATPRLVELVTEMVRIGRECRAGGRPLHYPRRILCDRQDGHHLPEEALQLKSLYPGCSAFTATDRTALQISLGHADAELVRQRLELEACWRRMSAMRFYERLEALPLLGRLLRVGRKTVQWLARKIS